MAADDRLWQVPTWPETPVWEPAFAIPRGRFGMKTERTYTYLALGHARRQAFHIRDFDIDRDRCIIFSDLHKGDRTRGADEFQINEDIYCHALGHYLGEDFRLVLNGDIEEGWKAPYQTIIDAYADTAFALEREFARRGPTHYLRTWGNHDLDWANPRLADRVLRPLFGVPVKVHQAILLGDHIMIAHGHQGEFNSDRMAWLSRRVIRYLWKPVQKLVDFSPRRTAQNYDLAHRRDKHLAAWASAARTLLIAGHTHMPTMPALNLRERRAPYLNDGCCVHQRTITGIEIDRGEIRLVKWDGSHDGIQRTVFQQGDLAAYLARL